ncbi:LOW QUALITY PROTEIN: hypothetical protein CFC21_047328 [Triticum aestivum]|uniref:RNase H type-1 domain-containing protein n=2 Tax=Triticum aestivum TaxID=4565 RepID=A0A3B6GWJ4_WHEAT|nr:LOW QUALITY PROTEIN: hypothetical protein CFC21_047328 [Triticum aestivum]
MAGYNRLIINFDNMEVMDTMKNGGQSAGAAAVVFDHCYFMACDFPLTFEHCNREANKVAHELAILAHCSMKSDWLEEPREQIVSLLINYVTILSN